jgi:hypothetical protein
MVDLPTGKQARLTVLSEESTIHGGYQVFPVPTHELLDDGTIREVFFYNQQAYGIDAFTPTDVATLAGTYTFRDTLKQKIVFYPIAFNPVTGDLLLRTKIRIRIDFVDVETPEQTASPSAAGAEPSVSLWSPPEGGTSYRILVEQEGIYQITRDWLLAEGLGAAQIDAIDLDGVGMFYLGEEIAIEVFDGDSDATLDGGDYIRFFGQPVSHTYSKYATSNVYWLSTPSGASRMNAVDGSPAGAATATTHTYTVRHELDQLYLLAGRGSDDIDRWVFSTVAFGDQITHRDAGVARDFTIGLPGVAGDNTGVLTIHMYSPYEGNHTASMAVNGTSVGIAAWSGIAYHTATFEDVDLLDGDNTVTITCTSGEDKIVFDWFTVTYERAFAAEADILTFSHDTGYQVPITGFSSNNLLAFDITDPTDVKRITNATVTGTGPYSFTFESPDDATGHSYYVLATDQTLEPQSLQTAQPHGLTDSDSGADWILITHRDLGWDGNGNPLSWLSDLSDHREVQGLRVKTVDIAQIYDGFAYGIVSPQAIKDFIAYAYTNWTKPAPRYVLIVGDASYDVKDNWGVGTVTYVPSYLILTEYMGETATDQWYVQIAGEDALPDLSIGRLPAKSVAEAAAMAQKITTYEETQNDKSWEKDVLLVADNQVEDFESVFETMNEDAAARVPAAMDTPSRFYLEAYEEELLSVEDLTADLVAAVNTGALVLNYSGHAAYSTLASERIVDNRGSAFREDADLLTNTGRYPLVINMSCLSGYFLYPGPWTDLYNYNYHSLA